MFGYVTTDKGELKVKEYEAYRGVYCSLCRALGKRYGMFTRLILSYDATFLAVLFFAQHNLVPDFRPGRCPFNPAKRCSYCKNGEEIYNSVCAIAVLMFYYKVRDDLADGGFFKRCAAWMLLPFAAIKRRKAKRINPEADRLLSASIESQKNVEQKKSGCFDEAAHASADALGKLIEQHAVSNKEAYYKLGYFIGRWVYLMDAADDLKQDLKHRNYNVFIQAFSLDRKEMSESQTEQIRQTLNASAGMAVDALMQTGCQTMRPILENILFNGTYKRMEQVLKGDEKHERSL